MRIDLEAMCFFQWTLCNILIFLESVKEARDANLNEITEVQKSLQETKDTIAALKEQLNEIHEHDAVLK